MGFGAVDLASVLFAGNIGVVVPSILAFIGCIAFSTPVFAKRILENRKEIKSLERAQRSLGKSSKYSKKSINQLVKLMEEAKDSLNASITELDEVIAEYENELGKINEDIVEEVLAKSGIEADVTLNSSMKVLSKRYEPKK